MAERTGWDVFKLPVGNTGMLNGRHNYELLIALKIEEGITRKLHFNAQWGSATGNAAPVATVKFYVLKENKAEKIP
jgi:hypothetical protein